MPTFDFTAPDGKTYSVDGPDGATPDQAFKILQDHLGASSPAEEGSSVGGTAKALGVGVAKGTIGLVGLPGDLYHAGLRALGDTLTPESNYGSDAIQRGIEGYTGKFYQPKGGIERGAETIGEFAPAVIGGPESIGVKLATRVAAPALASEAAGALTQGTAAEPYARAAGAIVGAGGATAAARKFQEMAAAKTAANVLPTGDQLVSTGSKQFDQARDMNVVVKPDFASNTASDMRAALKTYDPQDAGVSDVFRKIDRLDKLSASAPGLPPVAVDMNEVENVRKQLSALRTSADANTRSAAKTAQLVLTKNQMALTPADVLSGDAAAYANKMQEAVGNYGAGKRSQIVQGKQNLAELNAATAGSGANVDNGLRQAFKQLARPVNNTNMPVWRKLGFNADEGAAIEQAAKGTVVGNTARYLGKGAPTGLVSAAGGLGIGHMAGGPLGAIALPAAGYVAKKIGDLSTKKAVAALDSLVRSHSPLAAQVAQSLPQIVQKLPPQTTKLLMALSATQVTQAPQPAYQAR